MTDDTSTIQELEEAIVALQEQFLALLSTPTGQNMLREYRLQRIVDDETATHPWFKAWMIAKNSR